MTNDLTKYLKECLSLCPALVSAERPEKYQFKLFMKTVFLNSLTIATLKQL